MSHPDPRMLPVACSLTPGAGDGQLSAWREFNDDYLLELDRSFDAITAHYAKVEDAIRRLTYLVEAEQSCCATQLLDEPQRGTPGMYASEQAAADRRSCTKLLMETSNPAAGFCLRKQQLSKTAH